MAGYIGTQAVSVNTTSATISDDLAVGDDLTVTDDAAIGGTLGVTGIATFTDDIIIGDGKTIGSASDVDAITIAANGQVTLTQTLIGTALDISGNIDVDGITNLDVVDIDGAVNLAAAMTLTSASYFIASAAQGYRFNNAADNANNMIISDAGLVTVRNGIDLTDGNLIVAAGHGIDFSAQAANGGATAELLDHYEEGTWTPTIASDAAATAYTTQLGFYTRIGSICHVSATVQISNLGSFAGAVINLQGFPFTISDAANYNPIGSLCLDGTANAKENIFLRFTLNTTLARLEQANGQTTHDNNMNANAFDTGTILKMSGTYIVK